MKNTQKISGGTKNTGRVAQSEKQKLEANDRTFSELIKKHSQGNKTSQASKNNKQIKTGYDPKTKTYTGRDQCYVIRNEQDLQNAHRQEHGEQAVLKSADLSKRQQIHSKFSNYLQDTFGASRNTAHYWSDRLIGTDDNFGVADFTPLGIGFASNEIARSLKGGNYVGAAFGMAGFLPVPGAKGVKPLEKSAKEAVENVTERVAKTFGHEGESVVAKHAAEKAASDTAERTTAKAVEDKATHPTSQKEMPNQAGKFADTAAQKADDLIETFRKIDYNRPSAEVLADLNAATPKKFGGEWRLSGENSPTQAGAAFQHQVTGVPHGYAYYVNDVKFDGIRGNALVDAKDLSFEAQKQFLNKEDGLFHHWFGNGALADAKRQVQAANSTPIEWVISDPKLIDSYADLLERNKIKGIKVVAP